MISYGFSFIYNYIGEKEYLQTNINQQMIAPYGRIFIIQITLILGVFISLFAPSYFIIVFVILKINFDLFAHLKVHTE